MQVTNQTNQKRNSDGKEEEEVIYFWYLPMEVEI